MNLHLDDHVGNNTNPFSALLADSQSPQLDPNTTALLVVDMQYFDAHREWGEGRTALDLGVEEHFEDYFQQIDTIVPRIRTLLDTFRSKDMEVIHLRVAERTNDSRDVGWKQLVRGLVVPSDSQEAEFLEELVPVGDELIISKSSSGVFPATDLDRLLRNMNISTLVMVGTSTGGCVESAVRDAEDLGYDVIVVEDACACSTEQDHRLALQRMASTSTKILTMSELAALLSSLPNGDREKRSGLERVKPYLPKSTEGETTSTDNPYSLIFPPAERLSLSITNTALCLIDVQRLTSDPDVGVGKLTRAKGSKKDHELLARYYRRVTESLTKMSQLLEVSRSVGLQVIHVRTSGRLPDGKDLAPKLHRQGLTVGPGSLEAEFMPDVSPVPGEAVFDKPSSGAFTGTGLDEFLRNLGIKHIILAGVSYSGSIEGTIRSITDRGYGLVLAPDACAVAREEAQERLWKMEVGIIQVMSVEQLCDQLVKLESSSTGGA